MRALLAAGATDSSAPGRRRHLTQGLVAAGTLSFAVHAAVLFGSFPAGGAAENGAPPAPVLITRLVVAPEATAVATPEPVPVPVPIPPPVPAPSPTPAVQPQPAEAAKAEAIRTTPDRDASRSRPEATPPATVVPEPAPTSRPPAARPLAEPSPAAEIPPVSAPPAPAVTYQGALGLDPPPRPLGDIEPLVPETAGARGGVVVLRLYINEQGIVDRAEVLRSTPPGLFDASALEAFGNARFSPGYLAGVPVKSQMTFEVKYRALGSGAESSTRTY